MECGTRIGRHRAAVNPQAEARGSKSLSGARMMNENDLHGLGLKLRTELFVREAVEKRMNAFGDFGKPLQHIINAYAYGDVWQRTALPQATKSLVMIAMMAAAKQPNELAIHIRGALQNGC